MSIRTGDLIHVRDNSISSKVVAPICPAWAEVKDIELVSEFTTDISNPLNRYILEGGNRTYYAYAYHKDQEFHRVQLVTH